MSTNTTTPTSTAVRSAPRSLVVTLWVTLLALVATLAGMLSSARTPGTTDVSWLPEGAAYGAVVSQTGGLTVMTTDVGSVSA